MASRRERELIVAEREFAVFVGLDVGKGEHHACALDADGTRIHDKPLPQDETRLRELLTRLQQHGPVLVVVDQPASIGALPVAVARAVGAEVG
ncbi:MAG: transposase, partial [Actinomycetales bacterium]